MPRYFFDILNGGQLTSDTFGIELNDDAEAREQAISLLPEIARDELPNGDRLDIVVSARDETGAVVYEASLTFRGAWTRNRSGDALGPPAPDAG